MAILFCYFLINGSVLATSVIMEAKRKSDVLSFEIWEPFVWEYSSAIGILILFPLLVLSMQRIKFDWLHLKRSLFHYFLISIVFSLAHVGIMVGLRELVYFFMGGNYDFGEVWFELFYEYRKDLWSFIFFIIFIKSYQFILSRLQGEANPVAQSEDDNVSNSFERLLVKKLGKEFIVRVDDIEWLEASGNYVNLYIDGRIYPMRATLSKLVERLAEKGFCRIHRSHAINLESVESITPLSSGDSEVKLNSGKVLTLSRRYKDSFKLQLK